LIISLPRASISQIPPPSQHNQRIGAVSRFAYPAMSRLPLPSGLLPGAQRLRFSDLPMSSKNLPNLLKAAFLAAQVTAFLPSTHAGPMPQELIPSHLTQPSFSRDGRYLAQLSRDETGITFLLVTDCATLRAKTLVVAERDRGQETLKKVTSYSWAGSERLVITSDIQPGANSLHFAEPGKSNVSSGLRDANYQFICELPEDGAFLAAARPLNNKFGPCRVLRFGPKDSTGEVVYSCDAKTFECMADRTGRLRLVKREEAEGGAAAWFALEGEGTEWKKLSLPVWNRVFGFDASPDLILAGGYHGSGTPGIHYYSVSQDCFVHTLAVNERYALDQIARPLFSEADNTMVGMHVDGDLPSTRWTNPKFKLLQDSIDLALPGARNRIVAWSADALRLCVEHVADDAPVTYFLIDNEKRSMSRICADGGDVDTARTARQEVVTFENRTGVKLTGYLTRPKQTAAALSLVILVGPDQWSRKNNFGWDNQAQYLATQGYAVFRLNFRGTGGLTGTGGLAWKTKADALAAFEDIGDALDFLAREKGIDGNRIAIVGFGPAGGWIATYAPIALPKRFRCAASLGGVYDLEDYRNTSGPDPLRNLGNIPFATLERNFLTDDLIALSPEKRASEISCPLFIDYGRWSPARYGDHVDAFLRAARRAGIELERPLAADFYLASLDNRKNLQAYFERLAAFLKKHL
jgi:dienelactone hydrolase